MSFTDDADNEDDADQHGDCHNMAAAVLTAYQPGAPRNLIRGTANSDGAVTLSCGRHRPKTPHAVTG